MRDLRFVLLALALFGACGEKAGKITVDESGGPVPSLVDENLEGDLRIEIRFLAFGGDNEHVATATIEDGKLSFGSPEKLTFRRTLTENQLLGLKHIVTEADSNQWSGSYVDPRVLDGGGIKCFISLGDRDFELFGVNASPPAFRDLLGALDSILGENLFSAYCSVTTPGMRFESFEAVRKMESDELQRKYEDYKKSR